MASLGLLRVGASVAAARGSAHAQSCRLVHLGYVDLGAADVRHSRRSLAPDELAIFDYLLT